MQELVPLDKFEEVANFVCERISSDFKSKDALERLGVELLGTPTFCMSAWIKLAFARLWDKYQWLPDPHPQLHLIACVDELAGLGQLIELFENRWDSDYEFLACLKYKIISSELLQTPSEVSSGIDRLDGPTTCPTYSPYPPTPNTRQASRFRKDNPRVVSNLTLDQIIQFCQKNSASYKANQNFNQISRHAS